MSEQMYGTLRTVSRELPWETPERAADAEKENAQIAYLGARVYRGADDWAVQPDEGDDPVRLESGMLAKIFKTVAEGDVLWQGTVDYDHADYHHGLQRGLPAAQWVAMFRQGRPARLDRDGRAIYGALDAFSETGTEGEIWSLDEYGRNGYDALNALRDGDHLTVYSRVRDGVVDWEGPLAFGPEKVEKIGWTEILRAAEHMPTSDWLKLTWQQRPVIITADVSQTVPPLTPLQPLTPPEETPEHPPSRWKRMAGRVATVAGLGALFLASPLIRRSSEPDLDRRIPIAVPVALAPSSVMPVTLPQRSAARHLKDEAFLVANVRHGRRRDFTLARNLDERAIALDPENAQAQRDLGYFEIHGLGGPATPDDAVRHFEAAAEGGAPRLTTLVTDLERLGRISSAQAHEIFARRRQP